MLGDPSLRLPTITGYDQTMDEQGGAYVVEGTTREQ